MPFETPHDGSGTVLTFNSVAYTVTNVVVSATSADEDKIPVGHLGQTAGETAKTLELPLAGSASGETGRSVTFDYIGKTFLADRSTGSFVLTIGGVALSGVSSKAGTVTSSTLTLATQDAIRGQATIKLER